MDQFYLYFYHVAMIMSLVVLVFLMVLVWQRRQSSGALAMLILAAGTFIWTFAFLLEAHSETLQMQLLFNNIGYIGSMSVPVAWFIFSIRYVKSDWRLQIWQVVLLSIVPFAVIILVWTNGAHHLMWSNEHLVVSGAFTVTAKTYGTMFWVAIGYNYLLIAAGSVVLITRLFIGQSLYRSQVIALIIAVLLPWVWNIIYVFNLIPLPHKDLTPVMFSISGIVIALGLLRFRLFEAVPFAYKYLIHQMNDGIFVFSPLKRLLDANPVALKITRQDTGIIGKQFEELPFSPQFKDKLLPLELPLSEITLDTPDGARDYEMNTITVHDKNNRYLGWLAILHDITQQKQYQESIRESYQKEQTIRRELEAEIIKRANFTRVLVHELKTPLTAIVTSSELLDENLTKEQQNKILDVIKHSADNLNKRIGELLDFSRVEAGMLQLNKGEVSPYLFFERVMESVYPIALARNQTLTLELPKSLPNINIDRDRIQQVLFNLIDNAIKYNRPNGVITLRARLDGKYLEVSVQDTGEGIPKESQALLFSPYTRLQAVGGKGGGMGLGLAICKLLVEAHGGSIWLESEPGKGSTFSFRVPLAG